MWEYHAFISQLVKPGVSQGVTRSDSSIRLVHKHLRDEINSINVSLLGENLSKQATCELVLVNEERANIKGKFT